MHELDGLLIDDDTQLQNTVHGHLTQKIHTKL